MLSLAGPLISAGASLLGGLFGMSSEKKRDKENARRVAEMNADVRRRAEQAASVPIITTLANHSEVDVDAMMSAAERAGYNPVTWLRNGGMQAYTQTSSVQHVYNSQLMDAALSGQQVSQTTARGVGEVIGSALTTGASQWVAEMTQERQNQFQLGMLQAQLDGQARNSMLLHGQQSGYVPTAFLSGTVKTAKNSAILSGLLPQEQSSMGPVVNLKGDFYHTLWDSKQKRFITVVNPDYANPGSILMPPMVEYTDPSEVGVNAAARQIGRGLRNLVNQTFIPYWSIPGGARTMTPVDYNTHNYGQPYNQPRYTPPRFGGGR